MIRWQHLALGFLLAISGGACSAGAAGGLDAPLAATEAAPANAAEEAAHLLARAEAAGAGAERDRLVERLDALGVRLAEDAGSDDPLGQWRSDHKGDLPWRGRALGPAYRRSQVAPGERVVIEQIFLAGQRARIAAQVSQGGGVVALAIKNPRAEPVCTRQLSPAGSCDWLPIYTERFVIELHNPGRQMASVYLVVR